MSLCVLRLVVSNSLWFQGPARLLCPWGFSKAKNTGVGCHALLQGIFWTQKLNWDLLHCRLILDQLKLQIYMHNAYFLEKRINRRKQQEEHRCYGQTSLSEDRVNLLNGLDWTGEGSSAPLRFTESLQIRVCPELSEITDPGSRIRIVIPETAVIRGKKIISSKSLEWRYKWKNKEREFQWIMRHRNFRVGHSHLEQEWWEGTQDPLLWIPALGQLVCPLITKEFFKHLFGIRWEEWHYS